MNDFLEFDELKRWMLEETRKVSERLNREGAVRGLDTNREAYAYIHETFDRRLKEIVAKYKSLKQEQ
ncbi:MAG: hypothetical protein IJU71_11855 [Selenomonadaceae bacterium]|nr:hypothetical protein [Selenomonadaceae bacterium]